MGVLRWLRNIALCLLCAGALGAGWLTLKGWDLYQQVLDEKPLEQRVEEVRSQEGFTPFEKLPQTYVDAVVAVEDQRFFSHGGVDFLALGRALLNDLRTLSFQEGGSTITQQVAKNLCLGQEKSLERKVAEVFLAWDLEGKYSKEEIFELYGNAIYFGSGCYCVADASETYFGVEPQDMTPSQCTLLAGIPNAPSVYDLNENPELAAQRQRQVVERMVEEEYLSAGEAAALVGAEEEGT